MKQIYLIIYFIFFLQLLTFAGGASDNLQKYWVYRERVKNFTYNGFCEGSGTVANRGTGSNYPSQKQISEADQPWMMGYWIATLAMEYKLLSDHNLTTNETVKDLYFAIEAINRLDYTANVRWGCTSTTLDGFCNSDDLPDLNTLNIRTAVDGDKLINNVTKSWVPARPRLEQSQPSRANEDASGYAFATPSTTQFYYLINKHP
ncbi:MAG: hypothetical protein RL708_2255 [Bacteroidota bacterium]|jgi:hypothetical protein